MPFKSKEFSDLPIQLWQLGLALDVQVRLGSCVTSIAGPHGDAQLYWR